MRGEREAAMAKMANYQSRVLIVDDNADVRQSLGWIIEARGYQVDTAEDGEEALSKVRHGLPACLILLDLQMPKMDGRSLRRKLLRDDTLARVPVVLVSAEQNLLSIARELDTDWLSKPINYDDLFQLLDKYCPAN